MEIQQKIANWKAESLSFPISKELASEDASIARYSALKSAPSAKISAPPAKIKFRVDGSSIFKIPRGIINAIPRRNFA